MQDAYRKVKLKGDETSSIAAGWNEMKFDRQIAAIAKVRRAGLFYTDDPNQVEFAKLLGLDVRRTWDLDLPNKYRQIAYIEGPNG